MLCVDILFQATTAAAAVAPGNDQNHGAVTGAARGGFSRSTGRSGAGNNGLMTGLGFAVFVEVGLFWYANHVVSPLVHMLDYWLIYRVVVGDDVGVCDAPLPR